MNVPKITAAFLLVILQTWSFGQNKVNTYEGVTIGGIKQWIGAKSDDDSKPLLLFLHGGPGFSSRAYSKKFIKLLKKDFIVAQWDQRGTGITAAWGSPDDPITIELMHQDTEEVVNYLLKKFNKEKLYLVGFSWGGFLGFNFADKHPELLHAYIAVSAMIHNDRSESLTLALIKEKAKTANNKEALSEISGINVPFGSWEELYFQRKWTAFFSQGNTSGKQYPKSVFENWSQKWLSIFLEASMVNYTETVPEIHCPIYFFQSNKDLVANYRITQQYFDSLKANQKEIIWFDQSTHEIPGQEPEKFSQELIKLSQSLQ
ncbi:MAG: alpha/beta hydrolase [Bacteroidota bacterium]